MTDTDNTIWNAVCSVVIHVLLLLVDGADRIQTFRLPAGQDFSKKLTFNSLQISFEINLASRLRLQG